MGAGGGEEEDEEVEDKEGEGEKKEVIEGEAGRFLLLILDKL
jgi:hypothetical protein